jgi:hypothetical protein
MRAQRNGPGPRPTSTYVVRVEGREPFNVELDNEHFNSVNMARAIMSMIEGCVTVKLAPTVSMDIRRSYGAAFDGTGMHSLRWERCAPTTQYPGGLTP